MSTLVSGFISQASQKVGRQDRVDRAAQAPQFGVRLAKVVGVTYIVLAVVNNIVLITRFFAV